MNQITLSRAFYLSGRIEQQVKYARLPSAFDVLLNHVFCTPTVGYLIGSNREQVSHEVVNYLGRAVRTPGHAFHPEQTNGLINTLECRKTTRRLN